MDFIDNYDFDIIKGMEVNDCHIHIQNWEDGENNSKENFIEQLEEYQRDFKISKMNIVCLPYGCERDICQNFLGGILKIEKPNYYVHAGLMYPNHPVELPFPKGVSPVEQLNDAIAVGFDGIKMLEQKPNYRKMLGISAADEVYEPYFAKLEEEQFHVLWHACDPEEFWSEEKVDPNHPDWSYSGEGYCSFEELHEEVYQVLLRHPNLKVTMAHILFLERYPEKLIELFETYPNLCVDITPHTNMFGVMSENRDLWKGIFTKYADRIIFGTDYSSQCGKIHTIGHENVYDFLMTENEFKFWNNMPVHGLNLERETVEKIFSKNFIRILGNEPKPINKDAFAEYIKKFERFIINHSQGERVMKYCEKNGIL